MDGFDSFNFFVSRYKVWSSVLTKVSCAFGKNIYMLSQDQKLLDFFLLGFRMTSPQRNT